MILSHMIIKYLSFHRSHLVLLFYKSSISFSKKTAILFKIFISKISWVTFVLALYYGFKNFTFLTVVISAVVAVLLTHLGFYLLSNYLQKLLGEQTLKILKFFEYFLILFVIYYILYKSLK